MEETHEKHLRKLYPRLTLWLGRNSYLWGTVKIYAWGRERIRTPEEIGATIVVNGKPWKRDKGAVFILTLFGFGVVKYQIQIAPGRWAHDGKRAIERWDVGCITYDAKKPNPLTQNDLLGFEHSKREDGSYDVVYRFNIPARPHIPSNLPGT